MTRGEASRRYQIPLTVLKTYESWGLWDKEDPSSLPRQYDDEDLKRLRLIMTLKEIGFECREIKVYMELSQQPGTEQQRLQLLEQKRRKILEEIHCREEQVCRLDCLRHNLRKKQQEQR